MERRGQAFIPATLIRTCCAISRRSRSLTKAFLWSCLIPPHLTGAKETAWLVKKYGKLDENWPQMLRDGFAEGMRVLKQDGVLIFKWSEYDIPAEKVWKAIGQKPLFGHHSGKKSGTFWGCFMKGQT